jgi:phosphate transport system permease protein
MTSLTAFCTVAAIGVLLVILVYIAMQGIGALSLSFLTNDPRPVGEGGGIRNAIMGTMMLLLLSSAIGMPLESRSESIFRSLAQDALAVS